MKCDARRSSQKCSDCSGMISSVLSVHAVSNGTPAEYSHVLSDLSCKAVDLQTVLVSVNHRSGLEYYFQVADSRCHLFIVWPP
jgi:hypothetical protein